MLRLRLGVTSSVLFLGAAACFTDVGDGNGSGDGDGDGNPTTGEEDPTGDGDPTGDCSGAETCTEAPPPGWLGPVALYVGPSDQPPPTCPSSAPEKVADLYAGFDDQQTADTCVCECGPIDGADCGPTELGQSEVIGCGTINTSWGVQPNECLNLGGLQAPFRYSPGPSWIVGGSCTPSFADELHEAKPDNRVVACAVGAGASACADGVCAEPPSTPFDAQMCIAITGEVQCPSGSSYSNRSVMFTTLEDDRACAECSCVVPGDAQCTGKVDLLSQSCQLGVLEDTIDVGGCSDSVAIQFAKFVPDPITAECEAQGGGVMGDINPSGRWTVCCS